MVGKRLSWALLTGVFAVQECKFWMLGSVSASFLATLRLPISSMQAWMTFNVQEGLLLSRVIDTRVLLPPGQVDGVLCCERVP